MTTTTRTIDAQELKDRLDDPSLTIVDVRPLAAYNGWRLGIETRGGHLPGATAFPVTWLDAVDEAEIARLARDGLSNPQIGARLFLSSRTVQYHLKKVFTKLEISSRGQLHQVLEPVE